MKIFTLYLLNTKYFDVFCYKSKSNFFQEKLQKNFHKVVLLNQVTCNKANVKKWNI